MNEEQIRKGLEKHWCWLKNKEASEVGSFVIAHGKRKEQNICWHHGTCDNCNAQHTLICHFGYLTQTEGKDYNLCLKCFEQNSQTILFGWMNYNVDKTIGILEEYNRRFWKGKEDISQCPNCGLFVNEIFEVEGIKYCSKCHEPKEEIKGSSCLNDSQNNRYKRSIGAITSNKLKIDLCPNCHCMTHTILDIEGVRVCGKCEKPKKEGGE